MTNSSTVFKVGTRGSKLALIQTRNAIEMMTRLLPDIAFEETVVHTSGDRDRQTDLRQTSADFFSKELDDALLAGDIDCAIHSAKDLPDVMADGVDWLRLPWGEDPRDVIVLPKGKRTLPEGKFRVGISSERRAAYCERQFPEAEHATIRGNIESRLSQLDEGNFDMVITAAAALHRLDLSHRIFSYIPLTELAVPPGQGALALTFRQGDSRFEALRNFLTHPVVIAGAGIGSTENTTQGVIRALASCDVCFHDALMPHDLLEFLPSGAETISVGKRSGDHSVTQAEIVQFLSDRAKRGQRVVRLKGGDPAVFARLGEEVDALQAEHLPFRVMPGVGAMSVAGASTGILPTRRDVARGFSVMTPRESGSPGFTGVPPEERLKMPQILYMASKVVSQVAEQYLNEGFVSETPVAVIFDAGSSSERVISGTLADIADRVAETDTEDAGPALTIIGDVADPKYQFRTHAPLEGMRILYCGAPTGYEKAESTAQRFGGTCINLPMIQLAGTEEYQKTAADAVNYDAVVVTSPSCARLFLKALHEQTVDIRKLPKLVVSGPGTAAPFQAQGIYPDIEPEADLSTGGVLESMSSLDVANRNVLRLRSDKAGPRLADALRERGAEVDDVVFYQNVRVDHEKLPHAEAVIFTSSSSVEAFVENFSTSCLMDLLICVIGEPTRERLREVAPDVEALQAVEATVPACVQTIAGYITSQKMKTESFEKKL